MTTTQTRLFTVQEYHKMADLGILHPDERVELIEGQILTMAAKNPPHSAITKRTADTLRDLLTKKADIRVQEPIYIDNRSEPEPDIAVVKIDSRDYINRHPIPNDVFLVIEVADRTLSYDCNKKAALYADAGIPEYWVIDVKNEKVIIFREPKSKTYQHKSIQDKHTIFNLITFSDIYLEVDKIFP
ncbi:Uma2 family endonuclease [Gloeocapsa sp. BRSZ]